MKVAVIVFPGSNCDRDCQRAFYQVTGYSPDLVWHKETKLKDYDIIILPGGFSFGDYLRAGAIARFSPVMYEVIRLAKRGSSVIGICNGFQILTEAGLLPGALQRNKNLNFICKTVDLKIENNHCKFTSGYKTQPVIRLPIAHAEGNYCIDDDGYQRLKDRGGIVLRYSDSKGDTNDIYCPNGARDNIAGIINDKGNVFGLMPHPERAVSELLDGIDGKPLFLSMVN